MKKSISMLLVIVLALTLFAGCGKKEPVKETEQTNETTAETNGTDSSSDNSGNEGKTTISFTWWGGQERADATVAVSELFTQKYPNIKVETSFQPYDSYFQSLSVLAASDNLPDLFQDYIGDAETQQYLDKGLLEPLDSYIDSGVIDLSNMETSSLSSGLVDGKTYGLSLGTNAKCMFVDPELYAEAGLTVPEIGYAAWDDLEKDLETIMKATGAYGTDDFLSYDFTFPYYCRQNGESQYASEGNSIIGFSKDTYVNFYEMKLRWLEKGFVPPVDITQASSGLEDSQLAKGKAGVNGGYSSQYATIANAAGKEMKMLLLPGPNADKGTDIRAGMHISMSSKSQNKEAAAAFINFFLNDIDANKILKAERGMPISKEIRTELMPDFTPEQVKMAEFMDIAASNSSAGDLPAVKDATEIGLLMRDLEEQIVYGAVSPSDAYDQLAEEAAIN